jgi:hypothetical protein
MFSATVMTGISMKCWCTMPMPSPIASEGDVKRTASRRRGSLPRRAVEPVDDVHERRLAGPVLAQERVHLTAPQLEVDASLACQRAEALGDAAELEHRGARAPLILRAPWRRDRLVIVVARRHRSADGLGRRDLAALDPLGGGLHLGPDVVRDALVDAGQGDALLGQAEDDVLTALDRPVLDLLGRLEDAWSTFLMPRPARGR